LFSLRGQLIYFRDQVAAVDGVNAGLRDPEKESRQALRTRRVVSKELAWK